MKLQKIDTGYVLKNNVDEVRETFDGLNAVYEFVLKNKIDLSRVSYDMPQQDIQRLLTALYQA